MKISIEDQITYVESAVNKVTRLISQSHKPHPDDWEELKILTAINKSLYELYKIKNAQN